MSIVRISALAAALVLGLSGAALAQGAAQADLCDAQARNVSGYQPGLIPPLRLGPVTLRMSGSVAVGAARSSGPGVTPPVPKGAGSGAREMRRIRAEQQYRSAYATCMSQH